MRTSATGQASLLLLDVAAVIDAERIPYAVIGGFAAAIHGVNRSTTDMDVTMQVALPDLPKLVASFEQAGFVTSVSRGDYDDPIGAVIDLTDTYNNCVEVLIGIRGLKSATFSRAIEVPYCGAQLRVIGYEDFLAMKLAAGGPQDLLDVEEALKVTPQFDARLVRMLVEGYGKDATRRFEQIPGELMKVARSIDAGSSLDDDLEPPRGHNR